ncbi:ankyrin repeat domain-containing protein [Legionella resiliens]|uniref:Ankyrin repeat domain-containing protein n=1 Tax=Legionella resiliens TaxID=2905958 RepID=A0ABS8WZZ6_9GAMM|nr:MULTISPECIES: ankyrin repeat domain-containing protein [unclassified Legionella]MCE0721803.1 ankyrin repeat domain-containing protein [Legionella sp. 9fVS26]MCE3530957.1 ankyrin repeat domain-containing protein [Legionella sp. 8cVS16]
MPQERDEENKDWLIELMTETGYHPDPGGMCFGVANMGMQAILAEEFDLFETRFLDLIEIYSERVGIRQVIDMVKEEQVNPTKQLQDDAKKSLITTLNLEDKLREMRKEWRVHLLQVEKIDFAKLKGELTNKENEFLYAIFLDQQLENCRNELEKLNIELTNPEGDYLAFFEGVEIYQRPGLHRPLFEKATQLKQDTLLSAPLVLSKKLEQSGGISRISTFIGAYNSDELFKYFSTLKNELQGSKKPIVFILGSADHAITVGYDPAVDQWQFVNSGREPERIPGNNVQEISQRVFNAFSTGSQCAFATSVYCNKANEEDFKTRMTAWEKQPEFQEIHKIDAQKAKLAGSNLLLLAASDNDPVMVKNLIKEGVNPELVADEKGNTPMLTAVCYNHIDVLKELLACPIKITLSLDVQVDSLYKFARDAQVDEHVMDELIKKKIALGQPNDSSAVSVTLHELATVLGHTEISNLLEQYEQNKPAKTSSDPFAFFKSEEYLSKRPAVDTSNPEEKPVSPNPFDQHH